ncbi:MAG: TlpA disulfide reductase family protein [Rhodothermales bacterium]|nr:TlpA disulfide reductase family protein [Rhodothermales bacterium]
MSFLVYSLRSCAASLCLASVVVLAGCGGEPSAVDGTIRSHFWGAFAVDAAVDSVADYRGFEVLIADGLPGEWDTLAYGVSGPDGIVEMEVTAPRADIFTLQVSRSGAALVRDEIVVADGDSATVKVTFPLGSRPMLIRSRENAVLMGFKNTLATHAMAIQELQRAGESDPAPYRNRVLQSAEILWGLGETNPGTIAGELASSQSILLLQDVNDSLLVARSQVIDQFNPNFQTVVETARRTEMLLHGSPAAVTLMQGFLERATDPGPRVAVLTELIIAYRDNLQVDEAVTLAQQMKVEFQDSSVTAWADRALYDLQNLMPGMAAPDFQAVTTAGDTISLASFRGRALLLEFYAPGPAFERELNVRNAFYRATVEGADRFEMVSFSLQPDRDLNAAFFQDRDIPGIHVFLEESLDAAIVEHYNINLLPTRFVIDADGVLVGKYVRDNATQAFQDALTVSLRRPS